MRYPRRDLVLYIGLPGAVFVAFAVWCVLDGAWVSLAAFTALGVICGVRAARRP